MTTGETTSTGETPWSVKANDRQAAVETLRRRYREIRCFSTQLTETLTPEDCVIQSMPDVSPTRWHLAHTTWFFETFVLGADSDYRPFAPEFEYLFNSYYNTIGEQFPRPQRGLLSRPSLDEIKAYREEIDRRVDGWFADADAKLLRVVELGLQHEQQHQELMLTDVKHVFSCNPLDPVYRDEAFEPCCAEPLRWLPFEEGLYEIGASEIGANDSGFSFDNESPRHRVWLNRFELSHRLVNCGEYLAFMDDGGYERPELWLSLGWHAVQSNGWTAPQYWRRERDGNDWTLFTLAGRQPLREHEPVTHLSYFEADAFARWSGARLPTEAEWETAAEGAPVSGGFADRLLAAARAIHPMADLPAGEPSAPANNGDTLDSESPSQLFGQVWQWTSSPYQAYPGYTPPAGALGEYNGKFMCNQYVLRGGSCATSLSHIRPTYRNFFPPDARWQFSGLRLARDVAMT